MNQITVDHLNEALNAATPQADGKYSVVDVFNAAQKLAEANAEQEQPLITTKEARKLGAGKAEWRLRDLGGDWSVISSTHSWFDGAQYRAIKQE